MKNKVDSIVIITFHFVPNYGAALQAYAMKHIFDNYGEKVTFLNYQPASITQSYRNFHARSFRNFISSILNLPASFRKNMRFASFFQKYIPDTQKAWERADGISVDSDRIVLGSDQIWNFNITDGYDGVYWGEIEQNRPCRIISYAASMGNGQLSREDLALIQHSLRNIRFLSVRETATRQKLQSLTRRNIPVVLDPTFLIDNQEWLSLSPEIKHKNYVLLYSLNNRSETTKIAQFIASEADLEIIEILSGGRSFQKRSGHIEKTAVGPGEFIGLIANASYVITDSYHGTVFSIQFQKDFYSYVDGSNQSRIEDLLRRLNLADRILYSYPPNMQLTTINYTNCNRILRKQILYSIKFIENAMEE